MFADNARLSASQIISQQYCKLQSSWKCHLSHQCNERPLLMVCFLKCLETSPFRWRWFCRCAINRPCHAFPLTRKIFTNGALVPKIYSACSFVDAMFSSGNFRETFFASCLLCMHRALPRANLHISVFRACTTHLKVAPAQELQLL